MVINPKKDGLLRVESTQNWLGHKSRTHLTVKAMVATTRITVLSIEIQLASTGEIKQPRKGEPAGRSHTVVVSTRKD